MREAVVRSSVFVGLDAFLQARGAALKPLLVAQGLGAFDALPDILPIEKVSRVFEQAAHDVGEPCLGLKLAQTYPVGGMGPLGFVVSQAESVRQALEIAVELVGALASNIHMTFVVMPEGIGRLEWMFSEDIEAPLTQLMDLMMATGLMRLGQIAGTAVVPLRAELSQRGLPCADLVQHYFGSQVRFNAPRIVLYFDPTTLARRNQRFDRYLYETVLTAARTMILPRQARAASIVVHVRQRIEARLGLNPTTLEDVAEDLTLPARSLQWQLEQAGTTYEKQLSACKRMLAARLLMRTDMSLVEIAGAVGFGQQSSFSRACQSTWFGMSPSKFRTASPEERAQALEVLDRERLAKSQRGGLTRDSCADDGETG